MSVNKPTTRGAARDWCRPVAHTYNVAAESQNARASKLGATVVASAAALRYALRTPDAVDQMPLCSRGSVAAMPARRSPATVAPRSSRTLSAGPA
jgi:hypothetical protein